MLHAACQPPQGAAHELRQPPPKLHPPLPAHPQPTPRQPRLLARIHRRNHPLARNIKGTHRINAGQFDGGKAIKHGRLSWRDETLQKLADNYHHSTRPDTFHFDFFSAEFPSPAACAKQNTTPALTLKPTGIYGCSHSGLLLSFRQDHFDELGETAVNASLNRLTALLQTTLRLKKQRQYAYPCNGSTHGAWTNCIMDLSPADAAEPNGGGWTINEEFADWAKF